MNRSNHFILGPAWVWTRTQKTCLLLVFFEAIWHIGGLSEDRMRVSQFGCLMYWTSWEVLLSSVNGWRTCQIYSRSTTTCLAAPIQAASPRNSIRWARNWRHKVISTGLLLGSVEALKSRLGRHHASGCRHLINMEMLHLSSVELSSLLISVN